MTGWLVQAAQATASITQPSGGAAGYPSLFLLVSLGSLVPVVPTGAVVSSAAVVAFHGDDRLAPLWVFLLASFAALLGDVALYWLGRRGAHTGGGSRWLKRLRDRADPAHLKTAQERLAAHGTVVLVLSRLIPAGRIPVMVACLLADMRLRTFSRADVAAVLVWAAAYQAIGVLGGSLFGSPIEGVALVVALTLAISAVPYGIRWIRRRAHSS